MTTVLADYNGAIGLLADVRIPALDRGALFADAAYEVVRLYDGHLWLPAEHFARLRRTLQGLSIAADVADIERRARTLVERSGAKDALVYCQVSRGAAEKRSHLFPAATVTPNVLLYVDPLEGDPHGAYREKGLSTITHEDQRWLRRDLKTVNLLPNCLARQAAEARGAQEAILVEADGRVTEATASNVFVVLGGKVLTAPLTQKILPGVTRAFVVGLARETGLTVEEKFFSRDVLAAAQEVFLTGTTTEVIGVTRIDGLYVGDGRPGRVTTQLHQAFRARVAELSKSAGVPLAGGLEVGADLVK